MKLMKIPLSLFILILISKISSNTRNKNYLKEQNKYSIPIKSSFLSFESHINSNNSNKAKSQHQEFLSELTPTKEDLKEIQDEEGEEQLFEPDDEDIIREKQAKRKPNELIRESFHTEINHNEENNNENLMTINQNAEKEEDFTDGPLNEAHSHNHYHHEDNFLDNNVDNEMITSTNEEDDDEEKKLNMTFDDVETKNENGNNGNNQDYNYNDHEKGNNKNFIDKSFTNFVDDDENGNENENESEISKRIAENRKKFLGNDNDGGISEEENSKNFVTSNSLLEKNSFMDKEFQNENVINDNEEENKEEEPIPKKKLKKPTKKIFKKIAKKSHEVNEKKIAKKSHEINDKERDKKIAEELINSKSSDESDKSDEEESNIDNFKEDSYKDNNNVSASLIDNTDEDKMMDTFMKWDKEK